MLKSHSSFLQNEKCSHFLLPMREEHGNTFCFLPWPPMKWREGNEYIKLSCFWGCFLFPLGLPSGHRCPLVALWYAFQTVPAPDAVEGDLQFWDAVQFQRGSISYRVIIEWNNSTFSNSPLSVIHLTPSVWFLYFASQVASNSGEK